MSQQWLAQLQDRLKVYRKCMLFKPNYMPEHESLVLIAYAMAHAHLQSFGSHTQSMDVDKDKTKFS